MDIADIATNDYVEVEAEERLGKVRSIFEEGNPKGIIVTEAAQYEGVITERQLIQSHIDDDTKVAALTTTAPKVDRTEDIRDTARMLVEGGTKIAPVFEAGNLWGIITEDDILESVIDSLDALTVGDIYTSKVITISEDDTMGTVINQLREHGISRLPVVDEGDFLTGIVTRHDIVDFVVRENTRNTRGDRSGEIERLLDLPVSDEMSSPVATATVEESVQVAAEEMLENDFSGLIVTPDEDDRVVRGVLTKTDILRALSYTEEEHLDVQVTNIKLLDTLSRQELQARIEEATGKYRDMNVHHAHVRLHKHKEKLRGTPLIQCQIRLRTNKGQVAGTGEGYGADNAFYMALDTLERNVIELKGIEHDEEYRGQLLRKLNEL